MTSPSPELGRRPGGLLPGLLGLLVSAGALVSYFAVVPRWPDLRDSGHYNVALGAVGAVLSLIGWRRAVTSRRRRRLGAFSFFVSLGLLGFLATYIYYLSYQLPSGDGAVPVGARAPAFALQDQQGRLVSLSDFSGKRLILVFFRGHW